MKLRILAAIIVLLHVLVHPAVHSVASVGPASPQIQQYPDTGTAPVVLGALGPCLGCQTASSLLAAPKSLATLPASGWGEKLRFPSEGVPSLSSRAACAARAPPLA